MIDLREVTVLQALPLLERGLPCFPCRADKRPATPRGHKDAARDPDKLRELWSAYPGPLIGVPTGQISGLDVLDIDARNGGGSWFQANKSELPSTQVHRTRAGGLHFMFQSAAGLRCSAGKIAAGVDVRADGGYVIWWPAAGLPILSESPAVPWPTWLLRRLSPRPRTTEPRIRIPDGHALRRLVE
jgi:hypothetical protein